MKKQKIFFGNKVEYNKITVNENKDGVFSEKTIRVDVIKENKDDVLFDVDDKSKEITNDKTIIVRTLENEGEKYKNETLENLEKKFKEEYDESQNEENNELNKEEDLEKNKEEKENQNEINTVYQIENIIDGQESEVSQNTGVFDVSELNKKLEKENEIKFDEMYQKAFGTEISEKRKERLKNEEKIDGISTLKPAKNETVFRNSGVQYKVIGTVFRTYIIFEVKDEMYLLDQHAAHERVLFEKVKSNYYKNEEKDVQTLLLPDIITLSYRENELAHENKEVFNKAGFEFEEFGINTVKLTAVPSMCEVLNTKELFLDILDEIDGQANSRKTRNRK